MAKKNKLKDAAVKIGTAVGKADARVHKAGHAAIEELDELAKHVEALKKQLKKSAKNLKTALK
jgi:hypothetical protein